jgi:hypothetical protein
MSPRENVLKLSVISSMIAVAVACAQSVHGAPIAYDGFDYPAASSLAGQNGGQGFSGAWSIGGFNVAQSVSVAASGSLAYSSLATTGNHVTTPTTSLLNGTQRNLSSAISSGTVYLSCLLRPEGTIGQGNGNGFFGVYLHGSLAELFFGNSGANGHYAMEQRGGFGEVTSADVPVAGQTEFLVLKATLLAGNDIFTLYTNPTPGGYEPSTGLVKSNLDIGTLSSLDIYSGGAFSIDELRVGTSYADVTLTPEPCSLVLLGVGAASLFAYAWRRRRQAA